MKSSIKIIIILNLAFSLTSWPAFGSTSQISHSGTEYPFESSTHAILLKWPRGSLIFPEINNPVKMDEVFLFEEFLTTGPELHILHHHYGFQFFSRKMFNQAKEEYLMALELQAGNTDILNRLGLIYLKSKDYREAETAYRKALQLDPSYTPAVAKLAICLTAQKKYSLAERKFKQAIKADPSNANYHLDLAHFYYYLKKNYRGALNSYRRALKLNPRLQEARNNMIDIKLKFKKWTTQESDFNNSWGSDFDYNGPANSKQAGNQLRSPEENNIAGTWEEQNTQRPLF
jgi:tetratricopeptide (TPR) repeat protein